MWVLFLYHDLNKLTVKRHLGCILRKLGTYKGSDDSKELLLIMLGMMIVLWLDKKMFTFLRDNY